MLTVIVTGPPGAGKSSLATAVHDSLGSDGVGNALVETDELERSYPALERDRTLAHLGSICSSYRDLGHELLFVTATIEDSEHMEAILRTVGPGQRLVIRLEADPITLERRIRDREPAGWDGLEELVASSAILAGTMPGLGDIDLVLDSDSRSIDELSTRVRGEIEPLIDLGRGR